MRRVVIALGLACQLFDPVDAFAQTGTITGVLTDAGTSAQIGGGVQAYTANGIPAQITGIFGGSPTTPYQILGLQPGTYFLRASSDGYVPELHGDIACVAADCSVTAGTPVVVTAGGVTTVDFALEAIETPVTAPVVSTPAIAVVAGPDRGRHTAGLTAAPVVEGPVVALRGDEPARRVQRRDDGRRTVTLRALERLELALGDKTSSCAGTWAGYLVDDDRLGSLPVGAAIDPSGTFYWQPGPGFIGAFELLFVRTACDGSKERLPLTVNIGGR